jgi:hypothetical protein
MGCSFRIIMSKRLLLSAIVLTLLLLAGCTKNYIPNTDVEDTEDNRRVVTFCETYRKAVERRDIGRILSMVSPRYYEDGGNVDASDDLDYEGLKAFMMNEFRESKAIRYEIRYRRVVWSEEADRVFVDYTYSASFKIPGPEEKDEWRRTVAENRLELLVDGENFKIASGL